MEQKGHLTDNMAIIASYTRMLIPPSRDYGFLITDKMVTRLLFHLIYISALICHPVPHHTATSDYYGTQRQCVYEMSLPGGI